MDVLVSPAPGEEKVWNVTDRLGRAVGQISYVAESKFIITAAEIGPDAPLSKMEALQPSLECYGRGRQATERCMPVVQPGGPMTTLRCLQRDQP